MTLDWFLIYDIVGASSLVLMAVFWIVFLFYSVRRIERGIVSEGKHRPFQWDPVGLRAFFYAWKVSFPLKTLRYLDDGLIDPRDVKRYSNGADSWLALILNLASHTFLLMVLVGWIFGLY